MTLAEEGSRIVGALRGAEALVDPVERYRVLSELQPAVDALVSAVKIGRGQALDELKAEGRSYRQVADLVDVRRYQTVQDLITAARAAQPEEQQ